MTRPASREALRVARIAELALRELLGAGEAPTPEAFARAYQTMAQRLGAAQSTWSKEAAQAYAEGRTGAAVGAGSGSGSAPCECRDRPATQVTPPSETRRLSALLAAALAALGSAQPHNGAGAAAGSACVELAARLLAGVDPRTLGDEIERALAAISPDTAADALPWRDVSCEALRHLIALLPEGAPAGHELQRARSSLRRAEGDELASTLDSVQRLLRRSVLAS